MLPVSIIILIILLVCSFSAFMTVRIKKGGLPAILLKALTSLFFISIGAVAVSYSPYNTTAKVLMIVGLCLGLAGDVLLDIKHFYPSVDRLMLNLGFVAFGLGHICYLITLIVNASFYGFTALTWPLIIAGIVSLLCVGANLLQMKMFKFNVEGVMIQSGLYLIVLSFVMGFSIALAFFVPNKYFITFAIAMVLFMASDVVLSFIYFGTKRDSAVFAIVNHALYYAAQLLLALTILII